MFRHSNFQQLKLPNLFDASANGAALCRRLVENEGKDAVAQGQKNNKDTDTSTVRPVKTVDAEGNEVTRYRNTGGREQ